jgi:predicted SnoaL-like aldol condensation-catalyzing enzyme
MKTKIWTAALGGGLMLATALLYAQPKANSIEANKKVVHDFYRFVWEPHNLDAFNQYTSPSYIEHNPMFPGPRENIIKALRGGIFGNHWSKPGKVEATLQDPPALVIAEGDLVQWIFKRTNKDPKDPSKSYESFWYDTFRVKDGKIVEHWDNATLR